MAATGLASGYPVPVDVTKPPSSRYVAILAIAACLILIGGWLVRPRDVPENPAPVPTETELQQLARRAERRSLERMTDYFAGTARDVEPSLVYIRSAGATGIAWDAAHIVTAPLKDDQPPGTVTVEGGAVEGGVKPDLWGPNLPLMAIENPRGLAGLSVVRRAMALPKVGAWIVAVWRNDTGQAFAAANFRQSASAACGLAPVREVVSSLSFTDAMVGGGLFDIDGNLLGAILPCGDRIAALDPGSIDALLERANTVEQRVLGRYGVLLSKVSEREQSYFKTTEGLLVREVWVGFAGHEAGLWPGDVITMLNGQPVAEIGDLRALTTGSESPFELAVQRGSKTVKVALPFNPSGAASSTDTAGAGLVLESAPKTYRIDSVVPDGRAARAGIEPGDRLVRIDRAEPRNPEYVRRILASRKSSPMLLEIERGARRLAIVVP